MYLHFFTLTEKRHNIILEKGITTMKKLTSLALVLICMLCMPLTAFATLAETQSDTVQMEEIQLIYDKNIDLEVENMPKNVTAQHEVGTFYDFDIDTTTIPIVEPFEREDGLTYTYTFDGWYRNTYGMGSKVGESIGTRISKTLYAKWVYTTEQTSPAIKIQLNTAKNKLEDMKNVPAFVWCKQSEDGQYYFPDIPTPEMDSYVFDYWDYRTTRMEPGMAIPFVCVDIGQPVIYVFAHWKEKYDVYFEYNGTRVTEPIEIVSSNNQDFSQLPVIVKVVVDGYDLNETYTVKWTNSYGENFTITEQDNGTTFVMTGKGQKTYKVTANATVYDANNNLIGQPSITIQFTHLKTATWLEKFISVFISFFTKIGNIFSR